MKFILSFIFILLLVSPLFSALVYDRQLPNGDIAFYELVPTGNPDIQDAEPLAIHDNTLLNCRFPTKEEINIGHFLPSIKK